MHLLAIFLYFVLWTLVKVHAETNSTISWGSIHFANNATAFSYTISYSNTDIDCFTDSNVVTDIAGSETMYTLTGLEEGTEYSVAVTAILSDGREYKLPLTVITETMGKCCACSFLCSKPFIIL